MCVCVYICIASVFERERASETEGKCV